VGKFGPLANVSEKKLKPDDPFISDADLVIRSFKPPDSEVETYSQILDMRTGRIFEGPLPPTSPYVQYRRKSGKIYLVDGFFKIFALEQNGKFFRATPESPGKNTVDLQYGQCVSQIPEDYQKLVIKAIQDMEPLDTYACKKFDKQFLITSG